MRCSANKVICSGVWRNWTRMGPPLIFGRKIKWQKRKKPCTHLENSLTSSAEKCISSSPAASEKQWFFQQFVRFVFSNLLQKCWNKFLAKTRTKICLNVIWTAVSWPLWCMVSEPNLNPEQLFQIRIWQVQKVLDPNLLYYTSHCYLNLYMKNLMQQSYHKYSDELPMIYLCCYVNYIWISLIHFPKFI